MPLTVLTGNIFTSKAQTIVNTVNCVGVMGAGIALECRLRFPEMYLKYVDLCENKQFRIGLLWLYKSEDRWILNFPTKQHWKYPSKIEYLEKGLEKFVSTYEQKQIRSIAFPLLGADKGGIARETSLGVMTDYLEHLPIEIEIYKYDPMAKDDLFDSTKRWLLSNDIAFLKEATGIRPQYLEKVIEAMNSDKICQLNQLASTKGVGINTLEKIFVASLQRANQKPLFE